jgi:1-acyl-sn-glycerol-3-phosphate acyltransferase
VIRAYERRWAGPLLDRYNHYLLRKSFARLRVAGIDSLRSISGSVIAAPNHSCWWDGCVDLYLTRSFLRRRSLLMMGETELRKYRLFSSLGVFSPNVRYIIDELKQHSGSVFWIYPQGEMLPARAPLQVREGALLISEKSGAPIVPVAHRYEFVRDDHPEVFVRFGSPLSGLKRSDTETLRSAMVALLQRVDDDIASQKFDAYEPVLVGAETRSERLQRLRETRA